MIKKIFAILVFSISFCLIPLSGETFRMAVFQLEPFMMEDPETGEITGIAVEYWRDYIMPRTGHELEVIGLFPILRVQNMLEKGEIDVIPLMTKIPEREKKFLYPDNNLTEIISCLIVKKLSPIKEIHTADDMFGMTIGFLESAYIPPMMVNDNINFELVSFEDYRRVNLNKLLANRVDAQLDINYISLMYYLKQNSFLDKVRIIMLPVEREPVYSIFTRNERGKILRDAFSLFNAQGLKDNVFKNMTDRFLEENDIQLK